MLACTACRGSDETSKQTITVHALAGAVGEPDAEVISHTATGQLIAEQLADPVGDATIETADGALISVIYPGDPSADTAQVEVVTTLAPAAGSDLTIYGPPDPDTSPPIVIGSLEIQPMQSITADSYTVQLGCVTLTETTLVDPIDISGDCVNTDLDVDLLVQATSAGALAGYVAGRLPLGDGGLVFQPAAWSTTTGAVPITLDDGVAPALDWVLYSDGLPFAAQPIAGNGPIWTGLVVDAAEVHAAIANGSIVQRTTREIASAPTTLEFGAADFLPPIAPSLALASETPSTLALTWTAASPGGSAVDAHLTWMVGTTAVVWDAVLPPDSTSVVFPPADPTLAALVLPPAATPTALLRYVDGPAASSFDDVLAAGIYADDASAPPTVVPKPTDGQIRESDAMGFISQ